MTINVSQISEDEGLSVERLYPEGEPRLRSEDRRILGRSSLSAKVTRKGKRVRLAGTVLAKVQIDCSRCLAPVSLQVDEKFDLLYIPPLNTATGDEEIVLEEEDLLTGFYQDDTIDLDDFVREQIELALPMTRLCSDECRGLCPECHANLNQGQCACVTENVDPRWAALKDWKLTH
jgi:uncharacterized protein